ncbi:hypothetical protein [uncultured Brachyspira sp.]|uniref:hypothetical protein n=1 Tax=uncultured Brachyspira sp. TaxID=221953 RepID=UPI0026173F67|nr:hypothetical protein [uncultured Brachyspira sp.]
MSTILCWFEDREPLPIAKVFNNDMAIALCKYLNGGKTEEEVKAISKKSNSSYYYVENNNDNIL